MRAGKVFRAVRTWMAPVDGKVRVSGSARAAQGKGNARVQILHNPTGTRHPKDDVVLWDWHVLKDGTTRHDVTAEVKAGGVIRFIADHGTVEWNPAVAYVE
jgi:hypothetical protein